MLYIWLLPYVIYIWLYIWLFPAISCIYLMIYIYIYIYIYIHISNDACFEHNKPYIKMTIKELKDFIFKNY